MRVNHKLSKTAYKCLDNTFCLPYNMEDYNVLMEFWIGRKFLGAMICQSECDEEIYIDKFIVNPKYRLRGYGREIIDYIKNTYRHILVESTEESIGFWRKCGFIKKRDQSRRIYGNTIDMHYKSKRNRICG